jgi:hypothetical protein
MDRLNKTEPATTFLSYSAFLKNLYVSLFIATTALFVACERRSNRRLHFIYLIFENRLTHIIDLFVAFVAFDPILLLLHSWMVPVFYDFI